MFHVTVIVGRLQIFSAKLGGNNRNTACRFSVHLVSIMDSSVVNLPEEQPSTDRKAARLARNRERDRNRRASESAEAREHRLLRDRARRRQRLASETAEHMETRLSRRRARDREWRAAKASQAREKHLQQMRTA